MRKKVGIKISLIFPILGTKDQNTSVIVSLGPISTSFLSILTGMLMESSHLVSNWMQAKSSKINRQTIQKYLYLNLPTVFNYFSRVPQSSLPTSSFITVSHCLALELPSASPSFSIYLFFSLFNFSSCR